MPKCERCEKCTECGIYNPKTGELTEAALAQKQEKSNAGAKLASPHPKPLKRYYQSR
ncbi:MAG: hypothetical protein WCI57_02595 [Candidatus Berkelbacteria bacterium]